jgi:hypothetical protein
MPVLAVKFEMRVAAAATHPQHYPLDVAAGALLGLGAEAAVDKVADHF